MAEPYDQQSHTTPSNLSALIMTAEWLRNQSNKLGAQIIQKLLSLPDHEFTVEELSDVYWKFVSGRKQKYPTTQSWGEPIKMLDPQALYQCRREAELLIKQIAAAQDLRDEQTAEELLRQYRILLAYIKETTRPNGTIKSFPGRKDSDYQRLFQAIRYIMLLAKKQDPEVYHCLRRHVVTGSTMLWRSDAE